MASRKEQKEIRRIEIIEAALKLFVKKGYIATQIKDIAKEAGMSTGLMFHYFESKEKLYEEIVNIGLMGTKSVMKLESVEPLEFFEQCAGQILYFVKEQPSFALMFVLMSYTQRNEAIPMHIRQKAFQVDNIEASIPIIEEGQKAGTIRQGNPLAISNAFWCGLQGIIEQVAVRPDIPLPEAKWIVDIIRG